MRKRKEVTSSPNVFGSKNAQSRQRREVKSLSLPFSQDLGQDDKKAFLNELYLLWISYPTQRFGQLLWNVMNNSDKIYHMTDRQFIERVREYKNDDIPF